MTANSERRRLSRLLLVEDDDNQRMTLAAILRDEGFDVVVVRDDGPGVSAGERERIFEPLYSSKAKGTGLGLTLCRQLLELHGGSIELEPSTGRGAAFRLRLPGAQSPVHGVGGAAGAAGDPSGVPGAGAVA